MAMIVPIAQADGAATIHLERLVSGELFTLAVPAQPSRESPAPLVVSLHYGGPVTPYYGGALLENVVEPALRALGAVMIAPDCGQPAWADCEDAVLRVIEHVAAIGEAANVVDGIGDRSHVPGLADCERVVAGIPSGR